MDAFVETQNFFVEIVGSKSILCTEFKSKEEILTNFKENREYKFQFKSEKKGIEGIKFELSQVKSGIEIWLSGEVQIIIHTDHWLSRFSISLK
jgi:hypothetical protein